MKESVEREVRDMTAAGMVQLPMAEIERRLADIGYRLDKSSRCTCVAKAMNTGNTYPAVTYGVNEADTGRSAFHFEGRRDSRFQSLQEMRRSTFAIAGGSIVSI